MKTWCFAAVLALLAAAVLEAQEGAGLLDVNKYFSCFPIRQGEDVSNNDYVWAATGNDYDRFANIGGYTDEVDTALEFALLSYYSQPVVNIRPIEAKNILPKNNPRLSDLKLGAAVFQEMQVLRFLGNTDAVGRHEGIIKFITDRGNVNRAEIETFLRQGIAALVDEQFKDVTIAANTKTAIKQAITNFFLTPNQTNYNGLKRYKYMRREDYNFLIAKSESDMENQLSDAEYYKSIGNTALADTFRKAAENSRDFGNTLKAARAYFDTLQMVSSALADKVSQESR